MTRTANPGPVDAVHSPHVTLSPLAYADVALTDDFWHRVQAVNRTISLAHGYAMLEQAGNFANLRRAGGQNDGSEEGEFIGFWFADSDVYKWLEALAWELGRAPDHGFTGDGRRNHWLGRGGAAAKRLSQLVFPNCKAC